jgi:hypothetical protein
MTPRKLLLLAFGLETDSITHDDATRWATDLRGHAKSVERAIMVESLEPVCAWRPIAEMNDGHGLVVVMNINSPGHVDVIHALDEDRDAFGWTHFAPVPSLTHEDAARLRAEMGK